MSADLLHTINWFLIGGTYLVGLINIVFLIKGSRRPSAKTETERRTTAVPSSTTSANSFDATVEGGDS